MYSCMMWPLQRWCCWWLSFIVLFFGRNQNKMYTMATENSPQQELPEHTFPDYVWTYRCVNNKCKRLLLDDLEAEKNGKKETPTSYNACKLFCGGGNGTLWPMPTGMVRVSGPAVPIDKQSIALELATLKGQDIGYDSFDEKTKAWFDGLTEFFKQRINKKAENVKIRNNNRRLTVSAMVIDPRSATFDLQTDESYEIKLEHDKTDEVKVNIKSENLYGLRHGLETVSQLIVYDNYELTLIMPWTIHITDKPSYPYRAITLDTSRNFIKIENIKRTIDAMAANKLNIFHWHLTDTHSFPLLLPQLPQLAHYGAYSPDKVYYPDQVKDLVEYARIRGVKVIPEFDAPAHVGYGWQREGVVVCLNEQPWAEYCVEAPCGQFDPTEEKLYGLLGKLYDDMYNLFNVDVLFHMGGDEVHFQCWNRTNKITEFIKNRGWKINDEGFLKLWNYFQQRALEQLMAAAAKHNMTKSPDVILWTSQYTTGLSLDSYIDQSRNIIQIWTTGNDPNVAELIKKGYRVIFSNYDALYLDCGFGSWIDYGNNWCSPYISWQKIYENDPKELLQHLNITDYKKQILGQSAALWTEQVEDASLDGRIWPRASALAERTWTDPEEDWKSAEYRFLYQRERLVQMGVAAEGQEPLFCSYDEGSCPSDNH